MTLSRKRWIWPPAAGEAAAKLSSELGVSGALARVLVNRGLDSVEEARRFLEPGLDQLLSPWLMSGMNDAVGRIRRALQSGETIAVHGDYDADGITATAIVVETLQRLDGKVNYYLPSRFEEGYGLHREALDKIGAEGASLLVTVDCGINAAAEVAYARGLGIDVIVTDHHQPLSELKGAAAVLNPLSEGCGYPFKMLSGAGVAFKLVTALMENCGMPFPREVLDLAALGTVADVVPLVGENRVIVTYGLAEINRLRRTGLKALAGACALKREQLTGYDLAFVLAPSLNAAGRMGDPLPAVRLLLEKDEAGAAVLAEHLRRENRLRRETEAGILREAESAVLEDPRGVGEKVITLAGEEWHHGVIGIVASRLVERFHRPVVLVALEGDQGRGSARSIPGFDITAALAHCSSLLEHFGGHEQAAGLTVASSRVEALREQLNRHAACLSEDDLKPLIIIDGELDAAEIDLELACRLSMLEPFGSGNPVPVFGSRSWELQSLRLVGAGKEHLKLRLRKGEQHLAPVYFSGAALAGSLSPGRRLDLAFTLRESSYRGESELDVVLREIRYTDCATRGRVEVIDRRQTSDRFAVLQSILSGCDSAAALFAGTTKRREQLANMMPGEAVTRQQVVFLNGTGEGAVCVLPRRCCDLFLYDLPLGEQLIEPFFECNRTGEDPIRVHLLYDRGDRERNALLLDMALPTGAALEQIREAMAQSAAANEAVNFPGSAAVDLPFVPGERFWHRCRDIFAEIGLLVHGNGGDRVAASPGTIDWPGCLAGSPAFIEALSLREQCEQFQELLLEGSPEDLAGFWAAKLD